MDRAGALAITSKKDHRKRPVPFSMRWVSLDQNRKNKPSKHMHHPALVRGGAAHNLHRHGQISVKPADGSGHPFPVHIDLITEMNGEKVI